jgi:hypothetical protein
LDESLRDLSWKPAAGYVIMLADTRFMAYKAPADFELLRRVLDSAVEFWMKQKVPFFVILADPSKTRIKRK